MDAKAKPIREILYSDVQFVIPFFQRDYSWGRSNWERLKADLWAILEEGPQKKHFLGPLVCSPLPLMPGDPVRFQLIDGQQRITTISLLLIALRDVAKEKGIDELAAEISETYLIHRFKKGIAKYKLLPRSGDRELFQKLVENVAVSEQTANLCEGYRYFRKLLRNACEESPGKLRQIFDALVSRLYLVVISLDEEDPYEIFESLNSTGLPLEESDLIRNFLFMQIPLEDQADFQAEEWQGFESEFDSDGEQATISPTAFYRDFLMRNGTYSKAKATFAGFKEYFVEHSLTPKQAVNQLRTFLIHAKCVTSGKHQDKGVSSAVQNFSAMDAATANPLLLNLMNRFSLGEITKAELIGCVVDLISFVLRRSICGESTRAYGRWFCELAGQLGSSPRNQLQAYLLHRGWPDDETFKRSLSEFPIYHREFRKCRTILEAIERSFQHKESVELGANIQIEHIMPQTLPKGEAGNNWKTMLGTNNRIVHKRYLHTLGNLTLTGYNPKLSNRPFSDKKSEFSDSNLSINKDIVHCEAWNEEAITARCSALADKVLKLWSRPNSDIPYEPQSGARVEVFKAARDRRAEYWARFSKMLESRNSALRPVRPVDGTYTEIYLPFADVAMFLQFLPPKRQMTLQLRFTRARGRKIFQGLFVDRETLDSELPATAVWDSGEQPRVTLTLENVSLRDQLDWLEQHEWMSRVLSAYHRVFFDRLMELNSVIKESSENKQLLLDYWTAFHKYLFEQQSPLLHVSAQPLRWNDVAIGRSSVWMSAIINPDEKILAVSLMLGSPVSRQYFPQLEAEKQAIEQEFGAEMEWMSKPDHKRWYLKLTSEGHNCLDISDWPNQHRWFYSNLKLFDKVFRERVAKLEKSESESVGE